MAGQRLDIKDNIYQDLSSDLNESNNTKLEHDYQALGVKTVGVVPIATGPQPAKASSKSDHDYFVLEKEKQNVTPATDTGAQNNHDYFILEPTNPNVMERANVSRETTQSEEDDHNYFVLESENSKMGASTGNAKSENTYFVLEPENQ